MILTLLFLQPSHSKTDTAVEKIPTDQDILCFRHFTEPLVPSSKPGNHDSMLENLTFAQALEAFVRRSNSEDTSALTQFLESYPQSRWKISLLTNLGLIYRRAGYFSKALTSWEEAWNLGKHLEETAIHAVVDRAVGELAQLNSSLGRFERLDELFRELQGRNVRGCATEMIAGARDGRWMMAQHPEDSFRCGPMALHQISKATRMDHRVVQEIFRSRSTSSGMSLVQVRDLSKSVGMNYEMVRREGLAPLIVPAVVHWKVGHFAALVKEEKGRYLLQDPTFDADMWVSPSALNAESSGYFLVASSSSLPDGWKRIDEIEGSNIWGKGVHTGSIKEATTTDAKLCKDPCPAVGMPNYNFNTMLASLHEAPGVN
jgi:hypothetical protein